ncbi:MAG: hypothetical protein HFI51_02950 [Lachnospiraceae bacterium]|jgi:hypothetical protein|nr:hypothetical protein [Lachnospiraceae bacterium]
MVTKNFWLGCNELIIVFRNGTFHVLEEFENFVSVFSGHFDECFEYCKNRLIDYEESVIG